MLHLSSGFLPLYHRPALPVNLGLFALVAEGIAFAGLMKAEKYDNMN